MFGSVNYLSKKIQEAITSLNEQNTTLDQNTALPMYLSVKDSINNLLLLPDSLNPQGKIEFFNQISQQCMGNRMGMQQPMGQQPGMNPGMGMNNQGMGMNQSSGLFGNMFSSTQPQSQGMFGSTQPQNQGMFGSSGQGMFTSVLAQLNQLQQQFDSVQGMGGPENDMTDSMKVQSVQPILISILISLNALAMQIFPIAHPNKPIENILKDKCAVLDSAQGSQFRQPVMQQRRQQNSQYNEYGGRRRTRRRRKQRGGGYSSNTSSYGSNAGSVGGRRRKRRTRRGGKKSCKR